MLTKFPVYSHYNISHIVGEDGTQCGVKPTGRRKSFREICHGDETTVCENNHPLIPSEGKLSRPGFLNGADITIMCNLCDSRYVVKEHMYDVEIFEEYEP